MVLYYEPRGFGPDKNDFLIYVGKDKFENEELIAHGLPTDIWCALPTVSESCVSLAVIINKPPPLVPSPGTVVRPGKQLIRNLFQLS